MSRGATHARIAPEVFVRCWETADSAAGAAAALSEAAGRVVTGRSARARADRYRSMGVDLKVMGEPDLGLSRADVRRLNRFIASL